VTLLIPLLIPFLKKYLDEFLICDGKLMLIFNRFVVSLLLLLLLCFSYFDGCAALVSIVTDCRRHNGRPLSEMKHTCTPVCVCHCSLIKDQLV